MTCHGMWMTQDQANTWWWIRRMVKFKVVLRPESPEVRWAISQGFTEADIKSVCLYPWMDVARIRMWNGRWIEVSGLTLARQGYLPHISNQQQKGS